MNVLRYIPSKDIRKYLREIKYEFTPLQAAFLIDQNPHLRMKTKFAAWQELIDTTPDCPMPGNGHNRYQCDSLHAFLKEYMDLLKRSPWPKTDHETDIAIGLEMLWFNIPTPFKRGDIVVNRRLKKPDVCVLDCITTWDKQRCIEEGFGSEDQCVKFGDRLLERHEKYGDYTDMSYSGYYVAEDGYVFRDHGDSYLDLEYYTEPLTEKERLFCPIHDALLQSKEDGIDLARLINLSHFVIEEEKGKVWSDGNFDYYWNEFLDAIGGR